MCLENIDYNKYIILKYKYIKNMSQNEINKICEKLGVAPIFDLQIPSETEFKKMFEDHGSHVYDDSWEESLAYNNFMLGYMLSEIKSLIQ